MAYTQRRGLAPGRNLTRGGSSIAAHKSSAGSSQGKHSNYSQRQRRHFRTAHSPKTAAPPATTEEAIPIDLKFGAFDFQEYHSVGQRGGGVRELSALLRSARRQKTVYDHQLETRDGVQHRQQDLLQTATKRALGEKIKDDPTKISKALAKRRSKKRQSAKKWAKRIEALHQSVEKAAQDRSTTYKGDRNTKNKKREAKKELKGSKTKGGKFTKGSAKGGSKKSFGKGGKGKGKGRKS